MELMIVVVIVGILAAIALPAYSDQMRKSNRSAAQQFLQDLANRNERYRLDARAYTNSINVKPRIRLSMPMPLLRGSAV